MIDSSLRSMSSRILFALLILLFGTPAFQLQAADTGPALQVNVSSARHAISAYIYGINYADESLAKELRLPVRRWVGNATTRYNWKNNMSNRAADWYFENLSETNAPPSVLPDGSAANQFIEQDRRPGTRTLLTVPLIGWTPKDRGRNCGFSISKYGPQQDNDKQWWPDCGNGMKQDGKTYVTGNDPHDTSVEAGPDFAQEWLRYLISRYGTASLGGVTFYNLDNEPMLWMYTHRDVHPQPTTYDEMQQRTYAFASAIKQVDPSTQTLGPVEWGWNGYFYSALDTAPDQWWTRPPQDRNAHGGIPFVDWYLQQMQNYERSNGVRILDCLDLHFYPQGNGVSSSDLGSASVQSLRLRSTRGLWDPTYRDESWINDYVRLIPRMRDWVSNNYPGTKLAITEYNWGALGYINGALAQADVLGIFGREQLDLACLWGPAGNSDPWAYAFRMYRNYDGAGGSFGDISVASSSADPDKLAIYAAQRSLDRALALMVINKTNTDLSSSVSFTGFTPVGPAKVYLYSAGNLGAIVQKPDQPVAASGFSATFPTSSITLLVITASPIPASSGGLIFAHLAAGGGYSTTLTLVNTGDRTAEGSLTLMGQDGQPLNVTLAGPSATPQSAPARREIISNTYPISLAPGATTVLTASRPATPDAKGGWAHLDVTGGSVSGVATFQLAQGTAPSTIAGVMASHLIDSAAIPVESSSSQSRYAGFAVANPGASDVHLTVSAVKEDGTVVKSIRMDPLGSQKQIATFLHQIMPDLADFQGSMVVSADPSEKFAVVALNENQKLDTAIPVIPQKPAWQLVWSDEFNAPDNSPVDSSKWVMETGNNNGWGNKELEYYTNRTDNARIENGMLAIIANKESYSGYNYTSARLKTQGKFTQKYGKFEARIKLPQGQGMWPAFWMLGDDIGTAGWPTCGEIDIMENIGKEPSTVHGTIHGPGYSGGNGIGLAYSLPNGQKFADDFHVLTIEWDPDAIRWYVDGVLYETRTPKDLPQGTRWVFDHPFFIILNVAVGGSWPGYPDDTTVFPQKMLVDYVRVYQKQ
jgi:beta-glucanase (GH16 family)